MSDFAEIPQAAKETAGPKNEDNPDEGEKTDEFSGFLGGYDPDYNPGYAPGGDWIRDATIETGAILAGLGYLASEVGAASVEAIAGIGEILESSGDAEPWLEPAF